MLCLYKGESTQVEFRQKGRFGQNLFNYYRVTRTVGIVIRFEDEPSSKDTPRTRLDDGCFR